MYPIKTSTVVQEYNFLSMWHITRQANYSRVISKVNSDLKSKVAAQLFVSKGRTSGAENTALGFSSVKDESGRGVFIPLLHLAPDCQEVKDKHAQWGVDPRSLSCVTSLEGEK